MLDRWERIQALFHGALERAAQDRTAYLEEQGAGDVVLIEEVCALLAAAENESPALEGSMARMGELAGDMGLARLGEGQRIGDFELKQTLGDGSMGTVFAAQQENPHRTVALKVLHLGLDPHVGFRLFQIETEILARLSHPTIAHIYASGTTQVGHDHLPWFAMELIEGGIPLTRYAQAEGLSKVQRIRLFRKVCEGVQHGHARGVIHRDLKPSNILVNVEGQPKIIDFGVARPVEPEQWKAQPNLDTNAVFGTVAYMSPEQAEMSGLDIDTRSDVYALGLVLCELLTGKHPYGAVDLGSQQLKEALALVRQGPVDSSVLHVLPTDLRVIIEKCLRKDREQRYGSVEALSMDLGRYLDRQPVAARGGGVLYRAVRFVARNPMLVLATVGLVGSLVFAVISAKRGQARAELGRKEAQWGVDFWGDWVLEADPMHGSGPSIPLEDAILLAAERLDKDAPPEGLEHQLRYILGNSMRQFGRPQEAEKQLLRAYQLRLGSFGLQDERTISAAMDLASSQLSLDKVDKAGSLIELSADFLRAKHGEESLEFLASERLMARLLLAQDRAQEGLTLSRAILDKQLRLQGAEHADTVLADNNVGTALHSAKEYEEAVGCFERVLAWRLQHHGELDPRTLMARQNLGITLSHLGEFEASVEHLNQAQEGLAEVLGEDHPKAMSAIGNLVPVLRRLGRYVEAEAYSLDLYRMRVARLGAAHRLSNQTLLNLVAALMQWSRESTGAEQEQILSRVRDHLEIVLPHMETMSRGQQAFTEINFGLVCMEAEEWSKAERWLQSSQERKAWPVGSHQQVYTVACLVFLGQRGGRISSEKAYRLLSDQLASLQGEGKQEQRLVSHILSLRERL